jgi:hypothetical protein
MENILHILYAIVSLHIKSEPAGSLHPSVLDHIERFAQYTLLLHGESRIHSQNLCRTLDKLHTFIEAQQDGSKIKHFFHQREMSTLLKDSHSGLEEAREVFKVGVVRHMRQDKALWHNLD